MLLQQTNPCARTRHQLPLLHRCNGGAVAGSNRVGCAGETQQFINAGGGSQRQQKTASGLQSGQTIGGIEQKRHADAQLGRLRSRQQGHPLALGERLLATSEGRQIRHQITDHAAPGLVTDRQLAPHRVRHRRNPIVPARPTRHPLGIGDVAVAETSRKQNGPELITAQEHHHTLLRPWAVALGTQQQRPEAACRHDALEQTPGLRGRTLLARGIGAGHQHQMQRSWRALRPGTQAKAGVQPFGQRSNPGGQFTGTVRNKNNGRSWFCCAGTGQRKKCGWRDLNSQGRSHTPLKRACLPIPPHPRGRLHRSGAVEVRSYRAGSSLLGNFGRR